jgi:hypothetical protein
LVKQWLAATLLLTWFILLEPYFECKSGKPTVERTIPVGTLSQSFHSLGLDFDALLAGMLEDITAPRCEAWRVNSYD